MINVTQIFETMVAMLGVLITYIVTHVHDKTELKKLNRNLYVRLLSGDASLDEVGENVRNMITAIYSNRIAEETGPLNPVRTADSKYVVYGGYKGNGYPAVEFYTDTIEEAKTIRDVFKEHIVDEFRIKFLA